MLKGTVRIDPKAAGVERRIEEIPDRVLSRMSNRIRMTAYNYILIEVLSRKLVGATKKLSRRSGWRINVNKRSDREYGVTITNPQAPYAAYLNRPSGPYPLYINMDELTEWVKLKFKKEPREAVAIAKKIAGNIKVKGHKSRKGEGFMDSAFLKAKPKYAEASDLEVKAVVDWVFSGKT